MSDISTRIEVDASQHDHLDPLARQFEREVGSDKGRLQRLLEQMVVAGLKFGLKLLDNFRCPKQSSQATN
jgi:hypothetical protein